MSDTKGASALPWMVWSRELSVVEKPFHCLLSTESHHRKNNKIMVKTDETEADTHLSSPPLKGDKLHETVSYISHNST